MNREYTEVLVEQNINGTPDTAYVYGAAIGIGSDRLSLDRFDSSTGYYLYDPKGSVTGIVNEEGQIYQSYRYSVFGEITFGAPEYENEYTYNGESYNPNIKSQYLRARYYCVVTADFLTEDTYLGNIREPLTLNRYNYCVGNPVNYADPSGNKIFKDMWDGLRKWLFGDPDAPKPVTLNPQPITTPSPEPEPWLLPKLWGEQNDLYGYGSDILPAGGIGYALRAPGGQSEEYIKYLEQQIKDAEENIVGNDCETEESLYDIMNMHMSYEGKLALMYWETVNTSALNKGYLKFVEKSGADDDKGTDLNITNMKELQDAIDRANQKGTKIYLSGVKPHNVGDGSMTSGFGDYLTTDDIDYYEKKGYKMKTEIIKIDEDKYKTFVSFEGDVGFIPTNIVVEKYLKDIKGIEDGMKINLQKAIGEGVLYYGQREFDALIIARYQKGSLGQIIQQYIVNQEQNSDNWYKELGKNNERRANWEVYEIMFGNGSYISDETDLTPLYNIYVEGVTK